MCVCVCVCVCEETLSKLSDVTAFVQYWHSSLDIQLVEVAAEHGEPEMKQWVIVCTPKYRLADL